MELYVASRHVSPDIMLVMETYLTNDEAKRHSFNRGGDRYHFYHKHRIMGQKIGGGVGVLVKESNLYSHRLIHVTDEKSVDMEAITVEIRATETSEVMLVTAGYARNGIEEDALLDGIYRNPEVPQLLGIDANAHHQIWDKTQAANDGGQILLDWAVDNGLEFVNDPDQPTRADNTKRGMVKSSPDVTMESNLTVQAWSATPVPRSDHFMIHYEIQFGQTENVKQPVRKKYNLLKADWDKFTKEIEQQADMLLRNENTTYEEVAASTRKVARRCIPYGYRRNAQPLWSTDIANAQKQMQKYKQEMLNNPTPQNVEEYKMKEKDLLEYIRAEREALFVKSIEDLKPHDNRLWMYVSRYNKPLPPPKNNTLKVGNKILTTDKQKAKAFIKHYQSVSSVADRKFRAEKISVTNATFNPFTEWEYQTAKDMMANGKAPGPDEIHAEMIKHYGCKMNKLLLKILNRSLKTGDIPRVWKTGHIVPIPKPNKSLDEIESFRPITLTSHVAKIIERMVAHRVLHMIDGKIHPAQFGFQKGKSTADALASLVEYLQTALDTWVPVTVNTIPKSQFVISVLIDFSKAFDTLAHSAIIEELRLLGVGAYEIRWIRNFITGRLTAVKMGEELSQYKQFACGVPQGTVLGPLLFVVATNRLLVQLDNMKYIHKVMFADDLTLSFRTNNYNEGIGLMQRAINQVLQWAQRVHMIINVKKTTAFLFANNHCRSQREQGEAQLILGGQTIEFAETETQAPTKLLGLVLDRYVRFGNHAEWLMPQVQLRTYTAASLLRKESGVSPHTMSVVVKALIQSRLLYAAEVWYPYLGSTAKLKLQIEYNRALRLIHGLPRFTPLNSLLLEAGQLPLAEQVNVQMVKAHERWSRGYPELQRKLKLDPPPKNEDNKASYRVPVLSEWKQHTGEVFANLPIPMLHERRQLALHYCVAPWMTYGLDNIEINVFLTHRKKEEIPEEEQRQLVEDRLLQLRPTHWEVWTDGSMSRANLTSGAGAVITEKEAIVQEISEPTGHIASNYTAEVEALKFSLEWIEKQTLRTNHKIIILTDSQSALAAMAKGPIRQTDIAMCEIWKLLTGLARRVEHITFQHVFSHCGLEYNDKADTLAKQGATKPQTGIPTHVRDVITLAKRHYRSKFHNNIDNTNERILRAGTTCYLNKEKTWNRAKARLASQIRADCCPLVGYAKRYCDLGMPLSCRWCTPNDHQVRLSQADNQTSRIKNTATSVCPICQHKFTLGSNMRKHFAQFHPDEWQKWREERQAPITPNTSQKSHICDLCTKDFTTLNGLSRHRSRTHGIHEERLMPHHLCNQFRRPSNGPDETIDHMLVCPALTELRSQYEIGEEPFKYIEKLVNFIAAATEIVTKQTLVVEE